MRNPDITPAPSGPNRPRIPSHVLAMALIGAIGFRIEQGPNAPDKSPNFLADAPEIGPELPPLDQQKNSSPELPES